MEHETTLLTGGGTPAKPLEGPNAEAARLLYPTRETKLEAAPNATVEAIRSDPARALYPAEKQFRPGQLRDLALATNPNADAAALNNQQVELANVMADMGLGASDLATITSIVRQFQAKPQTPEEQAASVQTAHRALREAVGDAAFTQAVQDYKALIARDPRFADYARKTGLANHPTFIARMAELGRTARVRGTLGTTPATK